MLNRVRLYLELIRYRRNLERIVTQTRKAYHVRIQ